mmetsp:Transcript_8968/g.22481  ORF Transcript_8968/g.22481 Transcript_8968/m.22481 type:complete len:238 (-) Transcript_8968:94-807(-)
MLLSPVITRCQTAAQTTSECWDKDKPVNTHCCKAVVVYGLAESHSSSENDVLCRKNRSIQGTCSLSCRLVAEKNHSGRASAGASGVRDNLRRSPSVCQRTVSTWVGGVFNPRLDSLFFSPLFLLFSSSITLYQSTVLLRLDPLRFRPSLCTDSVEACKSSALSFLLRGFFFSGTGLDAPDGGDVGGGGVEARPSSVGYRRPLARLRLARGIVGPVRFGDGLLSRSSKEGTAEVERGL